MAQIGSFNSVILFGRLGKDPEYKEGQEGKRSFCRFSLATSEKYKEKKEITDWHIITTFGKQADWCKENLKKGDLVLVEGKLSVTFYSNNRYVTVQARSIIPHWSKKEEEEESEEAPY